MAPTILSNASWIHGKGYESFFVHALSLQKSMQKCSDPSIFLTNTTALHHGTGWGISPLHPAYPGVRRAPPPKAVAHYW